MEEAILYTKDHYWIIVDNGIATVGLSNFITDKMDDISYIEVQDVGSVCNKTDIIGAIAFDGEEFELSTPLTGEIMDINDVLLDEPQSLKDSLKDIDWIYKMSVTQKSELEELLTEEQYQEYLEEI